MSVRVLYDYQAFTMQTHGGVSRCFAELYKHLPNHIHAKIGVRESNNTYIQTFEGIRPAGYKYKNFICKKDFIGKGHLHLWYDKLTGGGYYPSYNQTYSIELLKQGNFDVFHPTFFNDYFLPYLNGKPFVLTIHDMIPELYPQYYAEDDVQIQMKKKLAPLAHAIIAVSETTKRDIIRILNVPEQKIHVIYHAASFSCTSKMKSLFDCPYILYVGERNRYKRFDLFLKYITPFLKTYSKVFVVCTGLPFNQDELSSLSALGVLNRFLHYWVANDQEFYSLYHHALCFIYTSEYEGFGLPILEAYQADCPVLLNNASCFPEIAGDAAVYFNMTSKESDLVNKMELLYNMTQDERQLLLIKQKQRLGLYSWEKSAKLLANLYDMIVR